MKILTAHGVKDTGECITRMSPTPLHNTAVFPTEIIFPLKKALIAAAPMLNGTDFPNVAKANYDYVG